jgi:hypothetical protein
MKNPPSESMTDLREDIKTRASVTLTGTFEPMEYSPTTIYMDQGVYRRYRWWRFTQRIKSLFK